MSKLDQEILKQRELLELSKRQKLVKESMDSVRPLIQGYFNDLVTLVKASEARSDKLLPAIESVKKKLIDRIVTLEKAVEDGFTGGVKKDIESLKSRLIKEVEQLSKQIEKVETIKGEKGEKGKDGVDGQSGKDGVDGSSGTDGKDGLDGEDGMDADTEEVEKELKELKEEIEKLLLKRDYGGTSLKGVRHDITHRSFETSISTATVGNVQVHICNSATPYTVTMPTAKSGKGLVITNIGTARVTIDGPIDTTTAFDFLVEGESCEYLYNGTNWI